MKNITLFSLFLFSFLFYGCESERSPVGSVDTFIGTDFHGHTYPGATVPQGSVQLSPDTRRGNWDACSGYHYSDSTIIGFSHTHLSGTGCIDLGDLLFHPTTQAITPSKTGYPFEFLPFSHSDETSSPGYYSVDLDNGIKVELTATRRVGVHRYTFPKAESAKIVIDLAHTLADDDRIDSAYISMPNNSTIEGMRITSGWVSNQHIYFVARFSEPFVTASIIDDGRFISETQATGGRLQTVVDMSEQQGRSVVVKVGISSVSLENARQNLDAEVEGFDFDAVRAEARNTWASALDVIGVEGASASERRIFYTSLYHTLIIPNLVSDVNGEYRTHNNSVASDTVDHYSTLSLWDVFRAWGPLMTIVDTTLVSNVVNSMLTMYEQTGELPVWPLASGETGTMIGYHSVSIIADAYMKGVRGFDTDKALEAMIASSHAPRKGTNRYAELGYIPANSYKESVSCVLENSYDDWCIAQFAQAVGRDDVATRYFERAASYINVFDGSTGFFRGKNSDSSWESPFNPVAVGRAYTEATAWQYRFHVPHDVNGLVSLMGSERRFEQALDSLFTIEDKIDGDLVDITGLIGQYAHGNEPSHHVAYLYNYIGKPAKSQQMIRRIQQEMYSDAPDGIIGNEDCGQMSAWYVMSAMGFYQVCPGSNEFVLNAPLFEKVTITMPNGKLLTITATKPQKNCYIRGVLLNGKPLARNFITYDQLMAGGELAFDLSSEPAAANVIVGERPYSMTKDIFVSIPYTPQKVSLFVDSVSFELRTQTDEAQIFYTLDGTPPTTNSTQYFSPVTIKSDSRISAIAVKEGYAPSRVANMTARRAEFMPSRMVTGLTQGYTYTYHEGLFSRTADVEASKPLRSGTMSSVDISSARRDDHFGYVFKAYINVPKDDVYRFFTKSDDGSIMRIGETLVVDNDSSHAAFVSSGEVALRKGLHPITLIYFEDYEGEEFSWGWRNPTNNAEEPFPSHMTFQRR